MPSEKPSNPHHEPATPAMKTEKTFDGKGGDGAPAAAAPAAQKYPEIPPYIKFFKNTDDDGLGIRAFFEAISQPQILLSGFNSLRTVAFIFTPLFVLAVHPNTMFRLGFPQLMIGSIMSTALHQPFLGLQVGILTWVYRGLALMLFLSLILNPLNLQNHEGAWWGLLAAEVFLCSLCTHGLMRRFFVLFSFLYMLMIKMIASYFYIVPLNSGCWIVADILIGTMMGVAATLFPIPLFINMIVDTIIGKMTEGMSKLVLGMMFYIWGCRGVRERAPGEEKDEDVDMSGVYSADLFFQDDSPFMLLEGLLNSAVAPLLWFANWEPTEFLLHNPIRHLKLSLLRRVLALMVSAFRAGASIARLRRMVAMRSNSEDLLHEFFSAEELSRLHIPLKEEEKGDGDEIPKEEAARREKIKKIEAELKLLRDNTEGYSKAFGLAVSAAIKSLGAKGTVTPKKILDAVDFDDLREKEILLRRNMRVEVLNFIRRTAEAEKSREEEEERRRNGGDDDADNSTQDQSPVEIPTPMGERQSTQSSQKKRKEEGHRGKLSKDVMEKFSNMTQESPGTLNTFIILYEVQFFTLISMIAGEITGFGDDMKEYDPSVRLGSCMSRMWHFWIVDPFVSFWHDLFGIVFVDGPMQVRILKDAVKMTCAFLSATALNLKVWMPPTGLHYFGATIILGLPTEEETLSICLCRIAGNTLGCALGYLARHNTNNLSQAVGMITCFMFVFRICMSHPTYGTAFMYSATMVPVGYMTSMAPLQLLTRVLSVSYAVVAYLLCCMFIFPNNPFKILSGYRAKYARVTSEIIDTVALLAAEPLAGTGEAPNYQPPAPPGAEGAAPPAPGMYAPNNHVLQLCASLNIRVTLLKRLFALANKWTPIAASQNIIRGSDKYPESRSTLLNAQQSSMVSLIEILVFAMQLLYRPRSEPPDPSVAVFFGPSDADHDFPSVNDSSDAKAAKVRAQRKRFPLLRRVLNDFADIMRLMLQDYIKSMHLSRTFDAGTYLRNSGFGSRVREEIAVALSYCYFHLNTTVIKDTLPLTEGNVGGGDDDDDKKNGGRDSPDNAMANPRPPLAPHPERPPPPGVLSLENTSVAENTLTLQMLQAEQRENSHIAHGREHRAPTQVLSGEQSLNQSFSINPNASFAGMYLQARLANNTFNRTAPSSPQQMGHESPQQQQSSMVFLSPGNEELGQNCSFFLNQSAAIPLSNTSRFRYRVGHGSTVVNNYTGSGAASPHGPSAGLRSTVEEAPVDPLNIYPQTVDVDPEAELQRRLGYAHHERPPFLSPEASNTPSLHGGADGGERKPGEMGSAAPVYQGPGFTYHEDDLDLPIDTDFQAIIVLLSTASNIIDQMMRMVPQVNAIQRFQQQLHESSALTKVLDKVEPKVRSCIVDNYNRYHVYTQKDAESGLTVAAESTLPPGAMVPGKAGVLRSPVSKGATNPLSPSASLAGSLPAPGSPNSGNNNNNNNRNAYIRVGSHPNMTNEVHMQDDEWKDWRV